MNEKDAGSGVPLTAHEVAGLRDPAEILIDGWRVPDIYASLTNDAFFAQGFNAAQGTPKGLRAGRQGAGPTSPVADLV